MDTQSPKEIFHRLLAQKLSEEFGKHNIEACYCEHKADVLTELRQSIPAGSLVSCGGSATLREIGVQAALKEAGYAFLDPDDAQGGQAKEKMAHEALAADYYLMGANALTVNGEIVNLDGIGNRAAALSFGPKHVIVLAGIKKVSPNLETATLRAKTWAAPQTLLLFKQTYASYDELMQAAEQAYSQMLVTRMSVFAGRLKVILIGEDLGF